MQEGGANIAAVVFLHQTPLKPRINHCTGKPASRAPFTNSVRAITTPVRHPGVEPHWSPTGVYPTTLTWSPPSSGSACCSEVAHRNNHSHAVNVFSGTPFTGVISRTG